MKEIRLEHSIRWISILLTIIGAILLVFFTIMPIYSEWIKLAITATLGALIATIISLTVRTLYSHATPLVISILGLPSSGKTVYLTVLFNELETRDVSNINFSRYGQETIEQVEKNISTLTRGKWLPPTKESEVSIYRANAVFKKGLFPKKYKIEIADYAGELLGELLPDDDRWLHKTKYFKNAIQSDAIVLSIDCMTLLDANDDNMTLMQSHLVAAIQVLLEEKGVDIDRKLQAPVAIVYMKSDLFNNLEEQWIELRKKMSRLESICKKRCANISFFYVSSVGSTNEDMPPQILEPFNVISPIRWILEKAST